MSDTHKTCSELVNERIQNRISMDCGPGPTRRAQLEARNDAISRELARREADDRHHRERCPAPPLPLRLFTAHLDVLSTVPLRSRRVIRDRQVTIKIRLAIMAPDLGAASARAESWFDQEMAGPAWHITFGTGHSDAKAARLSSVHVFEAETDVVRL